MASAFHVTAEQARKIESMAYSAEDQQVHLGKQDDNGSITLAFRPGYRQPDVDRILGHRLPTTDDGFHYRKVTSDGTMRDMTARLR